MRPIDADALIVELNKRHIPYNVRINKAIMDAPTIDIVRCKNCKHAKECEQMVVFENGKYITAGYKLDFCSYGERREP